jgi:small subunit ribosomal protein S6
MRTYELILVFDSGLEIEQIETELKKIQEIITRDKGLIRVWERWGKRRLAYEIRRRQYGYYSLVVFDVEAELVRELERTIRLTSSILRHLITIGDASRVPEVDEESVTTLGAARTGSGEDESESADEQSSSKDSKDSESTDKTASDEASKPDETKESDEAQATSEESQDEDSDAEAPAKDKKTEDVA